MKFQTPLTVLGGGPGMHSSPGLGRARGSEECWSAVTEVLCVFTPGFGGRRPKKNPTSPFSGGRIQG